jgi:hypothetical protein
VGKYVVRFSVGWSRASAFRLLAFYVARFRTELWRQLLWDMSWRTRLPKQLIATFLRRFGRLNNSWGLIQVIERRLLDDVAWSQPLGTLAVSLSIPVFQIQRKYLVFRVQMFWIGASQYRGYSPQKQVWDVPPKTLLVFCANTNWLPWLGNLKLLR